MRTQKKRPAVNESKVKEFHNKVQGRRLLRFMRQVNPHKRRAHFLNGVCSDAGVCIAFGKETATIKKHFNGFTSFDYLTSPVARIGNVSSNGFVNVLRYSNHGYEANAILKSASSERSDNLYYEYLVGQYINRVSMRYPCFVETYGMYKYVDRDAYHYAKNSETMGGDDLQDIIVRMPSLHQPSDFKEACVNAQCCAVLIQHIKDADSMFAKLHTQTFVSNDLLYVLFQIYMPLSALRYEFTHYDLHTDNVILYEPVKGSYIQYHYHMEGGNVISFKSSYIAKIIDYGRCFFEDSENEHFYGSSTKIHHELCKLSDCKPNCGQNVGFYWLRPFARDKPKRHYVSSLLRNMSHDLRLFSILKESIFAHISAHAKDIYQLTKQVIYMTDYGTKEETSSGISNKRIKNVNDLERKLQELIVNPMNIDRNDAVYASKSKLGDMHVYCDGRPLEYMASV
jgi:hypothetical protein